MEPMILEFKEPILFDGETFTRCDLSGLRGLTTAQLYAAQVQNGQSLTLSHMEGQNLRYAMTVAQMASGRPRGFFGQLKKEDGITLPHTVNRYLETEIAAHVTVDGQKLAFDKNVEGIGRELDLRGLEGLVADDYAAAQDEIPVDESANLTDLMSVKYACALAAIASGVKLESLMAAPFWVGASVRGLVMLYFFEPGSGTEDGLEESGSETS